MSMDEIENDVTDPSSEEEEIVEDEKPSEETPLKPVAKSVPYKRFQEVNNELKKLKEQPSPEVDALGFIKLGKKLESYSDDEIDFAVEFAKSKNPESIVSALENPMVQLAISANREKVEKERLAMKPSNNQPDSDKPMSLQDALANAKTSAEKEEILRSVGLYNEPKSSGDIVIRR